MDAPRGTLLIVDDDAGIRDIVRAYAQRDGFRVLEASDGESADRLVREAAPDAVVLDLMIPAVDGWELCRRWRAKDGPPVIMLTARGTEADRVLGLGLGADDYLVKPFSPLELMARVGAVLRRTRAAAPAAEAPGGRTATPIEHTVAHLDVEIDVARRRAVAGGRELALTRRAFDLLAALVRSGDRVSTRVELLRVLGDGEVAATDRAVDQHMVAIRRALADAGSRARVATVRGIGYRLEER